MKRTGVTTVTDEQKDFGDGLILAELWAIQQGWRK